MTWEIKDSIIFGGLKEFLTFTFDLKHMIILLYFELLSWVALVISKMIKNGA
jgi:hypothetical protein